MAPDIVLIVLDTVRRDRLSAYGYGRATSPQLDAFAAGATLFERAVSPAQWTIPAHASLFTGVYPTTHQATQANSQLSHAFPVLAEVLCQHGYHTAAFCNNPLVGVLDNGLQRGFDVFYNYAGAAPERPIHAANNPFRRAWGRFARRVSNEFAHSDRLFRVSLHPLLTPIWTSAVNYKGNTRQSVDDLRDYLLRHRQGGRTRPLFAFLNVMGAHLPYGPPQADLDRIAPELSRDAYAIMRRFNADAARWASPVDDVFSPDEEAVINAFYDAEIAHQDAHLGRLLATLSALDDTMVIVVADHGESHGDHGFFGHSFVVYRELVQVPLLIRYPERFPAGRRIRTSVSTRRVFHTVLSAAGLDDNGLSLTDVASEGGIAYAEAFPPQTFLNLIEHRQPQLIERLRLDRVRRAIYDGSHKLAVAENHVDGLFDLDADPGEKVDLSARYESTVLTLQTRLAAFVLAAEQQRLSGQGVGAIDEAMAESLRALGYLD